MGVLKVRNLSKAFGVEELFNDINFDIAAGDRVGFVGANGTGKTTLMRCLLGLASPDSGQVTLGEGEAVGYVEQEAALGEGTLYAELCQAFSEMFALKETMTELEERIAAERQEEVLADLLKDYTRTVESFERSGGYDYDSRIKRVAFGLGFGEAEFDKPVRHFSGGQKTRICLAKALIKQPNFLFLDEPTNHLDIAMVEWLEEYLLGYRGGVLIISHDRYFLDRVANRIFELNNRTVTVYNGNYTSFVELREARRAALTKAYEKQQAHINKTEEYIRRYKAGIKSKQARGRQKQLNRLERIVLPPDSVGFNYFAFNPPAQAAQRVLELEDVGVGYGGTNVFTGLSMLVRNGDGIGLVGANGAGKTTLLKLIVGELTAQGRVKVGSRVQIGYFSQQHEGLNPANTLLNELIYEFNLSEEQGRRYLGAFLFSGDDVFKFIGDLSGGEKARLAFLKLMLTGANFLVLDEPTNHLDIPAKEAVEEVLMAFPGTFIVVSHDRYFLDKVTNWTYELAAGVLTEYNGNYSYYHAKKLQLLAEAREQAAARTAVKKTTAPVKPPRVKSVDKEKLRQKYEGEIHMLEMELKVMERQLNDPATHADTAGSAAVADEYARVEKLLNDKYDKWAELD